MKTLYSTTNTKRNENTIGYKWNIKRRFK